MTRYIVAKKFMEKIKDSAPILTFFLVSMGAFKLVLFGEHYKLSLYNFISFSNMIVYTFDSIRGIAIYAVPVFAFFALKDWADKICGSWILVGIAYLIGVFAFYILDTRYYIGNIDFKTNQWLKADLEVLIVALCITLKKLSMPTISGFKIISRFNFVKLVLLSSFLFGYLKIDFQNVLYDIRNTKNHTRSKILFKKPYGKDSCINTDDKYYAILNTSDYVFLFNENDSSSTSIPIANVAEIVTSIDSCHLKTNAIQIRSGNLVPPSKPVRAETPL